MLITSSLTPSDCSALPTSPCRRRTRSQRSASSSGVRAKGIAVAAMPRTIAASGASAGRVLIEWRSLPSCARAREGGGADHVVVDEPDLEMAGRGGDELEHHGVGTAQLLSGFAKDRPRRPGGDTPVKQEAFGARAGRGLAAEFDLLGENSGHSLTVVHAQDAGRHVV